MPEGNSRNVFHPPTVLVSLSVERRGHRIFFFSWNHYYFEKVLFSDLFSFGFFEHPLLLYIF